jgi:hypothetical protein
LVLNDECLKEVDERYTIEEKRSNKIPIRCRIDLIHSKSNNHLTHIKGFVNPGGNGLEVTCLKGIAEEWEIIGLLNIYYTIGI